VYQRRRFTLFLGFLTALSPLAVEIYLPVITTLTDVFHTDIHNVNMSVATFICGNALGQFLGGALSDQLGRRRVSLAGIGLFFMTSALPLLITDIHLLQAARLIQGIGGGFVSGIVVAIIMDVYEKQQVSQKIATVTAIMLAAPLFAPLIGATLLQFGWHWIFIFLMLYSGVMGLVYWRALPETASQRHNKFSFRTMRSNYKAVLVHRNSAGQRTMLYALTAALVSSTFMTYVVNGANMMMNIQGMNAIHFSWLFTANGIALMLGNRLSAKVVKRMGVKRLMLIAITSQCALLCLQAIRYSFDSHQQTSIIVTMMIVLVLQGAMMVQIFGTYMSHFTTQSGSASSMYRTTMSIGGASIAALVSWLSTYYDIAMFISMALGSLLAAMVIMRWRLEQ